MIMKLTIRPFERSDLDGVYDIERKSFPDPWLRLEFKIAHWRNPSGFLVAVKDGKVAGYVIVKMVKHLEPQAFRLRRRGQLLNTAVDPEFRRRGIGKALMSAVIAHVQEEGAEAIRLEVRASNSTARNFYSKMGFKEKGRKRWYYLSEDAIVMERSLNI